MGSVFFDRIPIPAPRALVGVLPRFLLAVRDVSGSCRDAYAAPVWRSAEAVSFVEGLLYPIAQLSYSIYLVHEMLFMWLFPKIAPLFAARLGAYGTMPVDSAVGFAITLAIASPLYVSIERPCMRLRLTRLCRI